VAHSARIEIKNKAKTACATLHIDDELKVNRRGRGARPPPARRDANILRLRANESYKHMGIQRTSNGDTTAAAKAFHDRIFELCVEDLGGSAFLYELYFERLMCASRGQRILRGCASGEPKRMRRCGGIIKTVSSPSIGASTRAASSLRAVSGLPRAQGEEAPTYTAYCRRGGDTLGAPADQRH
jgi:hypothetical protein